VGGEVGHLAHDADAGQGRYRHVGQHEELGVGAAAADGGPGPPQAVGAGVSAHGAPERADDGEEGHVDRQAESTPGEGLLGEGDPVSGPRRGGRYVGGAELVVVPSAAPDPVLPPGDGGLGRRWRR